MERYDLVYNLRSSWFCGPVVLSPWKHGTLSWQECVEATQAMVMELEKEGRERAMVLGFLSKHCFQ